MHANLALPLITTPFHNKTCNKVICKLGKPKSKTLSLPKMEDDKEKL
jgi:hypothetical protein